MNGIGAYTPIFNTDQGSQFTSAGFTGLLLGNRIAVSMDGRGARCCNVFVERLWRSVKYEEVYLRAYGSVGEVRASISRYLEFYNRKRPHSSLDARTPMKPTSATCRSVRQHDHRRRWRGAAPVGLRPPRAPPRQRHHTITTGRGSTYPKRNDVSTKPATSRRDGTISGRKRHIVVDRQGLPMQAIVPAADMQDRDGITLMSSLLGPSSFLLKLYADDGD